MTRERTVALRAADTAFSLDPHTPVPGRWHTVFGRSAPLVVEIGFGNGEGLAELAQARPDENFLGIELYGKGITKLTRRLNRMGVDNVRILRAEGYRALVEWFDPGDIARVRIEFPDPWPKRRHHKRRLVAPPLVALLHRRVVDGGTIHLVTDDTCYAYQMRTVFEAHPGFTNAAGAHRFTYHRAGRNPTKYERKFGAQGHRIRHLEYRHNSCR